MTANDQFPFTTGSHHYSNPMKLSVRRVTRREENHSVPDMRFSARTECLSAKKFDRDSFPVLVNYEIIFPQGRNFIAPSIPDFNSN